MNSVWTNIVTILVFLQVFSLAAWLVWFSELALCDWTRTESGKTLDAPDERSSAFVNLSISRTEKDKENTVFGWAGAEEAAGLHCEDRPTTGPWDGARRRALQLCWCLCYAPSRLGSEQTRSETLHRLPRPTSATRRSNICCLQRSAGTHASEPELGSSVIHLHDYRTSGPQSDFMYGTKLLRKLYQIFNSSSAAKCHVRKGSDGSSRFRFDSFQHFKHFIPKYFQIVGEDWNRSRAGCNPVEATRQLLNTANSCVLEPNMPFLWSLTIKI